MVIITLDLELGFGVGVYVGLWLVGLWLGPGIRGQGSRGRVQDIGPKVVFGFGLAVGFGVRPGLLVYIYMIRVPVMAPKPSSRWGGGAAKHSTGCAVMV